MENINIKIKKLDERAVIPTYAHEGDVGMDLTAISVEYDEEKDMYLYHTGLAFESDFNIGQLVFVRSSNRKTDAYLCNHVAVVDTAIYRGEVILCFKNRTSLETMITNEVVRLNFDLDYGRVREKMIDSAKNLEFAPYKVGDRVAQMVFIQYPTVNIIETDTLTETERGSNGFGSTGN